MIYYALGNMSDICGNNKNMVVLQQNMVIKCSMF